MTITEFSKLSERELKEATTPQGPDFYLSTDRAGDIVVTDSKNLENNLFMVTLEGDYELRLKAYLNLKRAFFDSVEQGHKPTAEYTDLELAVEEWIKVHTQ